MNEDEQQIPPCLLKLGLKIGNNSWIFYHGRQDTWLSAYMAGRAMLYWSTCNYKNSETKSVPSGAQILS